MKLSRCYKFLMSAVAALAAVPAAYCADASSYASESVLSSGHWVKIKVDKAGIYEITYDQLRAWGFSNPTQVTVWGYGGASLTDNKLSAPVPDDLSQQFSYYHSGYEKLLFYGVADLDVRLKSNTSIDVKRNVYSLSGYYFLTDSRTLIPKRYIPYVSTGRITVPYHTRLEYFENDEMNPTSGGSFWFGQSLMDGEQTLRFPVQNFSSDNRSFAASFIYAYAANARTSYTLRPSADNQYFSFNSSNFPTLVNSTGEPRTFIVSNQSVMTLSRNTDVANNYWEVTLPAAAATNTMSFAALDYAALLYNRSNQMSSVAGGLVMMFPNVNTGGSKHNFSISNADVETQVWSIDDPYDIRPYSTNYNTSTRVLTASFNADRSYTTATGAARVIAFSPSLTHDTPEYVGEVTNQNLHGEEVPHMVIIATPALKQAALDLAEVHRQYQNMDVRVVTPEEVFNEFSSGTPTAMGVRRYAKMLYDRNPDKFHNILLFGLGSWDNRHLLINDNNYLITYQCEDPYYASLTESCYASDAYFGMMGDDIDTSTLLHGEMHVNVGRMPVDNPSDAANMVEKIRRYLANPPIQGSYNRALLFCDDGDSNDHLNQSDSIAAIVNKLNPAATVTKVYNALYPWQNGKAVMMRKALNFNLGQGQGYLGYAGHGRNDRLGYDQTLFDLTDIESNEYSVPPFTMLSTCDSYSFDRSANDIAGNLIRKMEGGSINVIGACRSVYKNLNQTLNVMVANEYFGARNGDFTGDVFRRARNNACVNGTNKLAVNTLCYNLAGDPALPIFAPTSSVVTTSVAGYDSGSDKIDVYPLEPFVIEGYIADADGSLDADFNGTVNIDIYDGSTDVQSSTKGESSTSHTKLVHLDETLLGSVAAEVKNGRFTATVTVPVPTVPESMNRISYYAANNDLTAFANGYIKNVNVNNYDASRVPTPDTTAPEITDMYIDDPAFVSGDETGSDITIFATIAADASGINKSSGRVGSGAKIVIDGSRTFPLGITALQASTDGSYTLEYGVAGLSDGYHTVELSLSDNAGNRSVRTLGCVVVNRSATATLSVSESPARTEATLALSHTFGKEPSGRLVIEDAQGRTVRTVEQCTFPYTWDLTDGSGQRVADGRYTAYTTLRAGRQYGNTGRTNIIVLK